MTSGYLLFPPGLAIAGTFLLAPIVAARADTTSSWLLESMLQITRTPMAWLVACLGAVTAAFASMLPHAVLGGTESLLNAVMMPANNDPVHDFVGSVLYQVLSGASLLLAATLVDAPRDAAASEANEDPWAGPSAR